MKLKKGDKVKIITGKDKGKTGIISKILFKEERLIIDGINIMKKHLKPNDQNEQGGIIDIEAPIHISNVKVVKENTNQKAMKKVKEKPKKKTLK